MAELQHSPLHDRHVAAGARFAEFGGWNMPLQYTSIVSEHQAVRESVGVFDVSHLGKLLVKGPDAVAFINRCFTNDLNKIGPGQAQYTLVCNDEGGVVDDLIAYVRSNDEVFLIPNAANSATVAELLRKDAPADIEVIDQHRDYMILAVQGPKSDEVLQALGMPTDFDYMQFRAGEFDGASVTVCRTGYTGERGYEIVAPSDEAVQVWDAIFAAGEPYGIVPAGLGARDTLRTEMGYPLHGQDLSLEISPVQAMTGWAVGWAKESFWGAEALRAEREAGPKRRLRAIKSSGRAIPRPGMAVFDAEGNEIGQVTSGTFSPTLKVGIGLALLAPAFKPGSEVVVHIRKRDEVFSVEKAPLVTPQVR